MIDVASRHARSILGVSIQFIDNGELKLRTFLMEKLMKSHTLTSNIFTVTSNNGSNMLATTRELDDLAMTEQDEWSEDYITGE